MQKYILAQQLADKMKAEQKALKEKEEVEKVEEEIIVGKIEEDKGEEITKEDIKAMFAH